VPLFYNLRLYYDGGWIRREFQQKVLVEVTKILAFWRTSSFDYSLNVECS